LKIKKVVREYPFTLTVTLDGLLAHFAVAFTSPTFAIFAALLTGAVLVRGRHTVTRMVVAAGIRLRHHASFHRFFSERRWEMDDLWKGLVELIAKKLLDPNDVIRIAVDDTAAAKTGGKIHGAGMVFDNRPAARKGWNLRWGHTWVWLTVRLRVRLWPDHTFALPVQAERYRSQKECQKTGRPFLTKPQLALKMIQKVVSWFPGRRFLLDVDGGYASGELMQGLPENVQVVGRLRHDAALYALPPPKRSGRGRPAQRGRRLATPKGYVARRPKGWTRVELPNGDSYEVQAWVALWWSVFRKKPILVVAARHPARKSGEKPGPVSFFYSTDLTLTPVQTLAEYDDRWSIECLIHEVKERMGFEDPQCRTEAAVDRTPAFLLWTAGLVQYWYLAQGAEAPSVWRPRWRPRAVHEPPSFSDMLSALRQEILANRFMQGSTSKDDLIQTVRTFIESAAYAA